MPGDSTTSSLITPTASGVGMAEASEEGEGLNGLAITGILVGVGQ